MVLFQKTCGSGSSTYVLRIIYYKLCFECKGVETDMKRAGVLAFEICLKKFLVFMVFGCVKVILI